VKTIKGKSKRLSKKAQLDLNKGNASKQKLDPKVGLIELTN